MTERIGIVGGGLTGILLALKLSQDRGDVTLIERRPSLGGRLFFSSPLRLENLNLQDAWSAQEVALGQGDVSGFGWEVLDPTSLEILERHIRNLLTENELREWEQLGSDQELRQETYVVRKE